jgi:hypothetical protein
MEITNRPDYYAPRAEETLAYVHRQREKWKNIPGTKPTIKNIVAYYKEFEQDIIKWNTENPFTPLRAYPFDWFKVFTPIEEYAWQIIRSIGRIVLYPQYPILNYRADFANPVKKIILECDGKEWHNTEKDYARDLALYKEGWKTFRITGSELHKTIEIKYTGDHEEDRESIKDFYLHSAEGVIQAIRDVYFTPVHITPELENDSHTLEFILFKRSLQEETLYRHKLIGFDIDTINL